jgi:hypothetical protein
MRYRPFWGHIFNSKEPERRTHHGEEARQRADEDLPQRHREHRAARPRREKAKQEEKTMRKRIE